MREHRSQARYRLRHGGSDIDVCSGGVYTRMFYYGETEPVDIWRLNYDIPNTPLRGNFLSEHDLLFGKCLGLRYLFPDLSFNRDSDWFG